MDGHRIGKIVEMATIVTVVYVLTDPSVLATLKPRVLLYTSRTCKAVAERAGRLGITAEAAYADTVKSLI
jgi:hypothetical protein